MKKINLLLPALLMCMLLICTGCNNAKLTEIENSATAFLQAADEGNYESVMEHCTEDALVQMNLLSLDPVYSSNSFFLGTGFDRLAFSQKAVTATEEYGKYLADALIQGYTIHEVSEKNDVGYVTATITTFAFDTSQPFTSTDFNDKLTTLMTDYTNANMEELSAAVYDKAVDFFRDYYDLYPRTSGVPFTNLGMAYIAFAREEKHLFEMLFLANLPFKKSLYEILNGENGNVKVEIASATQLGCKDAGAMFMQMWIMIHGIACMSLTGDYDLSEQETKAFLENSYSAFAAN